STRYARRRSRPHRCIDSANRKPPRNRELTSLPYGAAASRMLPTPSKGMNARRISAVTCTGSASVIHHTAIHTASAAVTRAAVLKATSSPLVARYSAGISQATSSASAGPASKPKRASGRDAPDTGGGAKEAEVSGVVIGGSGKTH